MPHWLLSERYYDTLLKNVEWYDSFINTFWDNGMINKAGANYCFLIARYPDEKPECPRCGNNCGNYHLAKDYKCRSCRIRFSLKSDTYLQNSKLGLVYWWRFAYLVGDMKITSASTLAKNMSITQKTLWWMMETLKDARKEQYEGKFVNGKEVVSFNNRYEIIELLMKKPKENG